MLQRSFGSFCLPAPELGIRGNQISNKLFRPLPIAVADAYAACRRSSFANNRNMRLLDSRAKLFNQETVCYFYVCAQLVWWGCGRNSRVWQFRKSVSGAL